VKIILCDIDGVIANIGHRLHYVKDGRADWEPFFDACGDDEPIWPMIYLLQNLQLCYRMAYITGRPERIRQKTEYWFQTHGVPWNSAIGTLMMRQDGDKRKDQIIKLELFQKYIQDPAKVAAVFEDRDPVVEMWRKQGLLCLQPVKGNY
jgi:hypothetical protein